MSKTYTIQATSWFGMSGGSTRSTVLAYTTTDTSCRAGYTSSAHRAFSVFFATDEMTHLAELDADAITSIKLKLTAKAGTTAFTTYGGKKKSTATTTTEIYPSKTVEVNSGSSKSLTLTSIGIPSTRAYSFGTYTGSAAYFTVDTSAAITLTVVTTETDYTLSYNANEGSGAPSSQTGTGIGSYAFTVSDTEPTRQGYTFKGWATSASATVAEYQGGDTITVSQETTTLYAVWEVQSSGGFHIKTATGIVDGTAYVMTASGIQSATVYVVDNNGTLQPAQ